MQKIIALFGFVFAFTASHAIAFPTLVPLPILASETVNEYKISPEVNSISTAETGENLYSEYRIKSTRTFSAELIDDVNGTLPMGREIKLKAGYVGKLAKTYDGFNALCYSYSEFFINHVECAVDKGNSGEFNTTRIGDLEGENELLKPAKYTVTPNKFDTSLIEPDFKRSVIYQGVSKGVIKISFREFVSDMARPAFTQDINYDLESDGTTLISFKGLRILVKKATSSNVEYQLLKPFSE